ncbi:reverse transcriptase domain-containing protein [Enterobacter mori]|uniref:reverse transcriptase domain-containing protein n=1 Tax=Enterobacter mori TaxID=539813 RepID=UPI003B84431A
MTDSKQAWEMAWQWLCRCRRNAPPDADIWHLWFHRGRDDAALYQQVTEGRYRLSPMQIIHKRTEKNAVAQWCARDALVLKWVAFMVGDKLPVHEACVHVKGHQDGRASLALIARSLKDGHRFVYRTDIRGYYRHIIKDQLFNRVSRYIADTVLRDLIHQYLYYSVEYRGEIHTPVTGISRGCALSPLMGATLLHYVDSHFHHTEGLHYVRYMDDFLFLSERRWPVRRARKQLYDFFALGGFEHHPDKTQMGRVENGFDWLGVWITDKGATGIAPRALEHHRVHRLRLEEQSLRRGLTKEAAAERVQQYERRWNTWAASRMNACGLPE